MSIEVLDPTSPPGTGNALDSFTPGMIGQQIQVANAENPANNGVYTIDVYQHPGKVDVTKVPFVALQTSDQVAQAVVTLSSPFHPFIESMSELSPKEWFDAVVT